MELWQKVQQWFPIYSTVHVCDDIVSIRLFHPIDLFSKKL